jgi:beta-glucosidase
MTSNLTQPDFYWGTATAAFQIEGSPLADGAAPSDWYRLTHLGDKVMGGDTADIACDHYHRWPEDLQSMSDLSLNAYRFSLSWPRIFSDKHRVNGKGLDFYDRLIDGLCERNITPFITLFHWDVPEWLDQEGGWLSKNAPDYFLEYAQTVFDRLDDRVKHWVTFNEPMVYYHSYVTGWHWPFRKDSYQDLFLVWEHILQAHHRTVALRKSRDNGAKIGMVHSYHLLEPVTHSTEDQAAVVRADGFRNRWFLDRLFKGEYPADMIQLFDSHLPQACREPVPEPIFFAPDFIGLNYYAIGKIQNDPSINVLGFSEPQDEFELQPMIKSFPAGLYEMVRKVNDIYHPQEMFITENGYLEHEAETKNDPLNDVRRQQFLTDHLLNVERCVKEGLPLKGYFHWSLLDNFEWRWGLNRRFGLIHVDRKDQTRRVKKSGLLYRDYIRNWQTRALA